MIAIDWGTSSFRAWRLGPDGAASDTRSAPRGILTVQDGRFGECLEDLVGDWLADGETRILMSGMIGSRQGWQEVSYLPCPAAPADLARGLARVPFDGAAILVVPGVAGTDPQGVAEVMRGEETQIAGLIESAGADALACLPGSHSKWVAVRNGAIASFTTYMTGEAYAALRGHTILGRLMEGESNDPESFARGVGRSADPGGLLHHLFGVRTLVLTGGLAAEAAGSYLSGLLIGHEVRAATVGLSPGERVHLVGERSLCNLYGRALGLVGAQAAIMDGEAARMGLARIGAMAAWT